MRYLILIAALFVPNFAVAFTTSEVLEKWEQEGVAGMHFFGYATGVNMALQAYNSVSGEINGTTIFCLPKGVNVNVVDLINLIKGQIVKVPDDTKDRMNKSSFETTALVVLKVNFPCK